MYWKEELGDFVVRLSEKKFKPNDFMAGAKESTRICLGDNLLILCTECTNGVGHKLQIVDTKTGDTVEIEVVDWQNKLEEMWAKMEIVCKSQVAEALFDGKKIEAIKLVRRALDADLKTAKRFIDSEWVWNKLTELTM